MSGLKYLNKKNNISQSIQSLLKAVLHGFRNRGQEQKHSSLKQERAQALAGCLQQNKTNIRADRVPRVWVETSAFENECTCRRWAAAPSHYPLRAPPPAGNALHQKPRGDGYCSKGILFCRFYIITRRMQAQTPMETPRDMAVLD
jgi:hypothetical protein